MLRPTIFRSNYADSFFDDFFRNDFWRPAHPAYHAGKTFPEYRAMKTDIREGDDGFEIDMNLPGFTKEDVKAELKDGYLTVTASHTDSLEEKDEEQKYIRRERYAGRYQRSFYVGDELTQEDVHAAFRDGVLSLSIPKKEPAAPEAEEASYITIEG